MKDEKFAQVKIEDLKKTYDEECDDVKRVLRKMYPEIFKEEKKYCCNWMRAEIHGGFIKDGVFDFAFSNDKEFKSTVMNVIYYCPRCGKNVGSWSKR